LEVIYYVDAIGNFGDDLNSFMWHNLIPNLHKKNTNKKILGVGSIINSKIIHDNHVYVLGSGAGYGYLPSLSNLSIFFVRGKLTTQLLNIDEQFAIADSAIFLTHLEEFKQISAKERKKEGKIIFIPHHATVRDYDLTIIEKAGIELVSPSLDAKYVIHKIKNAKLVIAEAMHAAIIADTLRVRWFPVVCSKDINTFKWLDWLSMFNIDYNPIYLGLPNFEQEQINQLQIKNNSGFYKPNYKNMTINELLTITPVTPETKVISENKSSFEDLTKIKNYIKQKIHEQKFITKLKNITRSKSYLSDDEIFYVRAKQAKLKLDEFIDGLN